MALKRPVSVKQAKRSPKAAARRESFCARMGGMKKKLTGKAKAIEGALHSAASRLNSPLLRSMRSPLGATSRYRSEPGS